MTIAARSAHDNVREAPSEHPEAFHPNNDDFGLLSRQASARGSPFERAAADLAELNLEAFRIHGPFIRLGRPQPIINDMSNGDSQELESRLKGLLGEGGFNVKHAGPACYDVTFRGNLREWTVTARLTDCWIFLRSYVMRVPESAATRAALFEAALLVNGRLSLGKLSIEEDSLFLDIEYRCEHLDAIVLRNLLGLVVQVGDEEYPKLFRIAAGDMTLKALGFALTNQRPA